jgi:uncharacterized small protein (DUF1192 family)
VTETNGSSDKTKPKLVSVAELSDRAAGYRTAIVALIAIIKRDNGYLPWPDQMLVAEIERLINEETLPKKDE